MGNIYRANYRGGDWDDFFNCTVFVSLDKEKVINWVDKFNRILKQYREFYSKFEQVEEAQMGCSNEIWIKDEYLDYFRRWKRLRDIECAYLDEIQLR